MYKVIKNGEQIAIIENPVYIKSLTDGVYTPATEADCQGIAINSVPYNLFGCDPMTGVNETVVLCECDGGIVMTNKADLVDGKVPESQLPKISATSVYEATIGTTWDENSETGVKTQTVLIPDSDIDEDSTAKVDHSSVSVDGTSDGYETFVEEENQYLTYITNGYAETVAGGIKFTIFGDPNTVSIPIVVEVV